MVTIKQPLTVENPTCCSLWYGRPGVTSCYCQREACGVGLVEDTTLYSCFNEGLLDVHDVEEMLGLVQLRSESKDHNDGDGGLPDCYCFPLCFCFFVSSLIFLYCSVALCYYWETKARTMVMVGDVCSAERGGQGCYATLRDTMLLSVKLLLLREPDATFVVEAIIPYGIASIMIRVQITLLHILHTNSIVSTSSASPSHPSTTHTPTPSANFVSPQSIIAPLLASPQLSVAPDIRMFGTKPVPAVGVSLGIERVFAIMEQLQKDRNEVR
ncbi:hypothetical protein POTOM_044395 [Populus tomentosa]|uniref:Uncharacterized protein n=1 Tax=Populus tomentosa TaxID=118781 RepID=A0A8X7YJD4_POPTO|nr:hypothetical protein POTOM_044395 [Populus tomentosa]